jgi:hypothetical protein
MKPVYQVKAWPDEDWWLARVIDASEGADRSPLNALTQARSLAKVDPMARDLIATILDAAEGDFDVDFVFDLPVEVNELVLQARGAREWADAAQELWLRQSAIAARALKEKGYSLREVAALLGISHQRVDQILESRTEPKPGFDAVYWRGLVRSPAGAGLFDEAKLLVAFRNLGVHHAELADSPLEASMLKQLRIVTAELAARFQRQTEAELEKLDVS